MFDHVVLNRSIDGPPLNIGEIAEALLFYQSVHIVLDNSTIRNLILKIGPHNFLKILSLPYVKATYIEEFIGVHTEQTPSGPEHSLISAIFAGGEKDGELKTPKKRLELVLLRANLTQAQARNFVSRFKNLVTFKKLGGDHFIKGGIVSAAMNDLSDTDYVSSGSRVIAKHFLACDNLPSDFNFKIHKNDGSFKISTNMDFNKANEIRHSNSSLTGNYTPASIAAELFSASYALILAAHYGGDFYTSGINSDVIQVKNKQILNRTNINKKAQDDFYTILLSGFPDIVTTLNSGNRSFDEFIVLLSKANRFKHWLKDKSPDENLISNYLQDISSTGWFNQTQGKVFRYIASTAIGMINPLAGLVASATDSFVLDKINFGWKPNQFINGSLKTFVDKENN